MLIHDSRNQPRMHVVYQFISDIANSECWIVTLNRANMIQEGPTADKIVELFTLEHK
jgi:hypothetical protein